jgi:phosphoglycolate phosphatase-like HAD superfamily hydrolase
MKCTECSKEVTPIVAIDIDGTLGDYHGHFLKFAADYLGLAHVRNTYTGEGSFKQWFIKHYLGNPTVGGERNWHEIKLAYRQGAQKRSMPVYEGAAQLCQTIQDDGAELWLTTTRPYQRLDNIDPDTQEWLSRHGIEYDGFVYGDNKYERLAEIIDKDRVCAVVDDLKDMYHVAGMIFGWRVPILQETQWNRAHHAGGPKTLEETWMLINMRLKEWRHEHRRG